MYSRCLPAALALACLSLPIAVPGAEPDPARPGEQAAGIVPAIEDGKRIYLVSQFARFAPQTAADVVAQIPGFSVTNVSNDRGLGEASQNVLIDGQRITGKGNDAMAVLRRIPAGSVLRLEIMDGAMLDISGLSGHVLNVVTESGGVQGNFVWRPQFRERVPTHWLPGELNVSGKTGLGDFSLGLRSDGFRGGGWGGETETRVAEELSIWRTYAPRFANDMPKLSGTFNRTNGSGSIWNLNASVQRERFRRRGVVSYQLPGDPVTTELSQGGARRWRTEIGADYEFAAGPGRLKLIGFFNQRQGPSEDQFQSQQAGESVPSGARFLRDATEGERVGRAEYRWKGMGMDWSLSGELAHNYIDATGALEVLDDVGEYQSVELPGASSRVAEHRGESILSFNRQLAEGWSLQLSGGGEYSRLHQDGEEGQTRHFVRPKGAVSLAWNPPSAWEMNLRLQRRVGQLNFFDFLASVDVDNNNSNSGNPELVPPQSWLLQLEAIRSLGEHGKLRMNLEAEQTSDIVEQIPISPTEEAPGNLPGASRLQLSLDASLLLDAVGIPGGKFDAFVSVRDTRVRDPLLGTHRELNGNRSYWNLDFRHDVPGTAWTWGLFAENSSTNYFYRLDYEERTWGSRPFGAVYLEHKDVFGLKLRLTVLNVLNSRDRSWQAYYVDRRDGPVDYTRDFRLTYHPMYRLQFSGTF